MSQSRSGSKRNRPLPELSRFEWQCLKLLWDRGEGSVRDLHEDLRRRPSYSTVRKIVERLEEKGAVERARREGKAWVYRPAVSRAQMVRKEVRRFLDAVFDGAAAPLVSHLADMDTLTVEDLRAVEERLDDGTAGRGPAAKEPRHGGRKKPGGKRP
jgi:predicted transcriptional regulator